MEVIASDEEAESSDEDKVAEILKRRKTEPVVAIEAESSSDEEEGESIEVIDEIDLGQFNDEEMEEIEGYVPSESEEEEEKEEEEVEENEEEDQESGAEDEEDEGDDVYEVEKVVGKRFSKVCFNLVFSFANLIKIGVDYQLKWVGYEQPTWEPSSNINCWHLVSKYEGITGDYAGRYPFARNNDSYLK